MNATDRHERPVLFVLFFLSGAAALIYEVLWLKELGLLFDAGPRGRTSQIRQRQHHHLP